MRKDVYFTTSCDIKGRWTLWMVFWLPEHVTQQRGGSQTKEVFLLRDGLGGFQAACLAQDLKRGLVVTDLQVRDRMLAALLQMEEL